MRRRLTLLLLPSLGMAACTLFTDLNGLSEDPTLPSKEDASSSGGPRDASPPQPSTDADAPPSDASTDAPVVTPGEPCSDPAAIVGRSDLAGLDVDVIPPFALDTYPYVAKTAGTARCLWLYVEAPSPSRKVRVGVYTHDNALQHPKNLVASVQLENVASKAWNKIQLSAPITINAGDRYWIGVSPVKREDDGGGVDQVTIRFNSSCPTGPFTHAMDVSPTGPLPQLFVESATFNGACDGAVYLGR